MVFIGLKYLWLEIKCFKDSCTLYPLITFVGFVIDYHVLHMCWV